MNTDDIIGLQGYVGVLLYIIIDLVWRIEIDRYISIGV